MQPNFRPHDVSPTAKDCADRRLRKVELERGELEKRNNEDSGSDGTSDDRDPQRTLISSRPPHGRHSPFARDIIWHQGLKAEMDFEQHVLKLLENTQLSAEEPRRSAEEQLQTFYTNNDFPVALCKIGVHREVSVNTQQAATLYLKNLVVAGWSPELDGFKGEILIGDTTKAFIKENALKAATGDGLDRRTQNAFAYIVARIASVEYPDDWSELMPELLTTLDKGTDKALHGALKVLLEVVEDGLEETQFFGIASTLVHMLHRVCTDAGKKKNLRALAVSVFRSCFDMLEMVLEGHKLEVKAFAEETVAVWMPFFLGTLQAKLPSGQLADADEEERRGTITLKLQAMKTLMRIRLLFPSVIAPQSQALFQATWDELLSLQHAYQATYVDDQQDGRLEDADGLPYTLDFLVLEDLDFLQACIRAPLVKKALEQQLQQGLEQNWIVDIIKLAVPYAQITTEEEGIWQIDVNVFLSEETSVTANYTARTACGDLIIKLGEWLPDPTMQALIVCMRETFSSDASWRSKEAVLYLLGQILSDWQNLPRYLEDQVSSGLLELVKYGMSNGERFLRSRGYLLGGMLCKSSKETFHQTGGSLLEATLPPVLQDESVVVQVSCIRALGQYVTALPPSLTSPHQASIIETLSNWLARQDPDELIDGDDLLMTLVETLRDTLLIDIRICVEGNGLNLLFSIATTGATNIQIAAQIAEVWEDVCIKFQSMGNDAYTQLCLRVLPSLTGAFNVGNLTEENALSNLAAELLSVLTEHAPNSLPTSFVPSVLPKILPLLLVSEDGDLLKCCTTALRYMLQNDAKSLLSYLDPSPAGSSPSAQKSGLECTLLVIERLLGPTVDDVAASEVGHLASALVSAASNTEQLTPYLTQLLQAVAMRLASATQPSLVQSLILVFARLCLSSTREVMDFIANIMIGEQSGLHIIMPKWLENAGDFAGYDEIRTNTVALARIYELHDSRLEQVACKGEIIIEKQNEGRIMTRSRAKQQGPEKWTSVSANVKIVKVLVAELTAQMATSSTRNLPQNILDSKTGVVGSANGQGLDFINGKEGEASLLDNDDDDDEDYEDDGEWEDEPGSSVLDLGLGATKAELMALGGEEGSFRVRQPDDETQEFLVSWFRTREAETGFAGVFAQLSVEEQDKLRGLA